MLSALPLPKDKVCSQLFVAVSKASTVMRLIEIRFSAGAPAACRGVLPQQQGQADVLIGAEHVFAGRGLRPFNKTTAFDNLIIYLADNE